MSTKAKIAAIAALLAALAAPEMSFAQQAIFLPDSYAWHQGENVPTDAHASVAAPTHHRGRQTVAPSEHW